jgi:hypothetical protein
MTIESNIRHQPIGEKQQPCIVVSQPMFFPWYGLLEQINLSDTFVFYDDVQFSKGSFSNRVQMKTANGIRWLTVPLKDLHLGQLINEVSINNKKNWQRSLKDSLQQSYSKSPFKNDMLSLVEQVFSCELDTLSSLSIATMKALLDYFDLAKQTRFYTSSDLTIRGSSSQRVLELCQNFDASSYLTGHGARHYLDHELFEAHNIDVNYMNYGLAEYPQNHGQFTPYVSALDLVANCGKEGRAYIVGGVIPWREFLKNR